jgi:hypothetical protein
VVNSSGLGIRVSTSDDVAIYAASESGGVVGQADSSIGVWGNSVDDSGADRTSVTCNGVFGFSYQGAGVAGKSGQLNGVVGITNAGNQAGVWGGATADAVGVFGSADNAIGTWPAVLRPELLRERCSRVLGWLAFERQRWRCRYQQFANKLWRIFHRRPGRDKRAQICRGSP